jgi:hypothetical protein
MYSVLTDEIVYSISCTLPLFTNKLSSLWFLQIRSAFEKTGFSVANYTFLNPYKYHPKKKVLEN